MTGAERGPLAAAYWQQADPALRSGVRGETFAEFDARVTAFMGELDQLPDPTVAFGHGMWMALLLWKLLGFSAEDSVGMQAFRRFQIGLPMPN
jgi:broad specificity phosphatase PhoE